MDWLDILKEFGPNGALLIFLIYAARWIATHVAKPLVESHKRFLDTTSLHMDKMERWLESQSKSLESQSKSLEALTETSALQSKMLEKLAEQKNRRTR